MPRLSSGHGRREAEDDGRDDSDYHHASDVVAGGQKAAGLAAGVTPAAPSLPARMGASLFGSWRRAHPPQRFAAVVGAALIVAGLAHLAAWLGGDPKST